MTQRGIVLTACVSLLLASYATGESCPSATGHWGYGRHSVAAWYGDLALIPSGPKLLVVDFRLGAPQAIIGELRLPGEAIAIATESDVAYVGIRAGNSSNAFLVTVDLSDPSNPGLIGRLAIARALSDLAVEGTVAYVTSLSEGLVLVDVSDPARPYRLSALPTVERPESVVARGDFVYLGNWRGLTAVDVSSNTQPSIASRQPVSGYDPDLALSENHLFVLSDDELIVFNLAVPARPARLGAIEPSGSPTGLSVAGTTAFVTQYSSGGRYSMAIIDVTDPLEPTHLGEYEYGPAEPPYHVAATNEAVLLSLGTPGTQLVDVSNPEAPQLFVELPPPVQPGDIVDAVADRGLVFLADSGGLYGSAPPFGWLRIIDESDDGGFRQIGSLGLEMPARQVAVYGDYVVVVHAEEEITPMDLDVIDTSDPSNPTVVGTTQLSGPPWGELVVSGHHAYVTDALLNIVDLSDPTNPVLVGETYGAGGSPYGLAVDGDRAYLAGYRGLSIIDVSDPSNPEEISRTPTGGDAKGVAVRDGAAFVSVSTDSPKPPWNDELRVYDITNDIAPVEIGSVELWGSAGGVSIDGDLLFVEVIGRGLLVVNVSDPAEPEAVGLAQMAGSGVGAGDRFYAVARQMGLDVFDSSTCANPSPSPDFVWSPREPTLGEEVAITDISVGAPTSWSWSFGDDATSQEQHPLHRFSTPGRQTVTLTAANSNGAASTDLWVPIQSIADPMREHYIVPAAAHGGGKAGTRWRTDLVLSSTYDDTTEAVLYLMRQGEDNTLRHGVRVGLPRGTTVLDDVVSEVFGEDDASGAIFITSPSGIRLSSKTFTLSSAGTFGQFIPAIHRRQAVSQLWDLIQLTQNQDLRTNLGLVNRLGTPLLVEATLYTSDHTTIGDRVYAVEPYGHLQINEFIAEFTDQPLDDGLVTLSGGPYSKFLAYASTIDNTTGDPAFMLPPSAGTEPMWIPAAAHKSGRNGTVWRTDLEVCATAAYAAECRIELFASGQSNPEPPTETFTLAAGNCVRYADVVRRVFGKSATGALRLIPTTGVILASSRTYTRRPDGGTFGQFIPAIPESEAIPRPRHYRILQLSHSADPTIGFRTNIGLVNIAAVPIEVRIEVLGQDDSIMHSLEVNLAPFEHRQLNGLLEGIGSGDLDNVVISVQSWTDGARYFAYASVVDNTSGDAVYLPAQ